MFKITGRDPDVEVKALPSRYPQGAEKVLVETALGLEVPAGGLPADVGAVVLNVATVAFIAKYLRTGMPLTTTRLTVDGEAVVRRQNVEVIIGTPIQEVLDFCGGLTEDAAKVLMGGPMMGIAVPSTDYPVLKQNNAILAFRDKDSHVPDSQACIHCGRCINGCPMGLSPVQITVACRNEDVETLNKLHAELCIECGTCTYVCPAMRPVTQIMRLAKIIQREKGGKK
jgi:electron transport complex protein RnfC